ncbi:MAG: phosphatase PAP2 family protein [Bacteroidota bacterium]
MLEFLDEIDRAVFLVLNSWHSNTMDHIMYWITNRPIWTPFYIAIALFIIYKYKGKALYPIATLLLAILLIDQVTSGFMKPFFGRLRPCYHPEIAHLVHLVKGCKAQFGFVSSHAANTFGLAYFFFKLFKGKLKYPGILFIWSTIITYSRIYVGVHYPGDVIFGALTGVLIAHLMFMLYKLIDQKYPLNLMPSAKGS